MKTLIIGAAGFVGKYLIEQLSGGSELLATKLPHENIKTGSGCKITDLDILDGEAVSNLLSGYRPDRIFHIAAQSSVALSWEKPRLTVDVNINGTLNLLEAVRPLGYKPRLLLVGSSEEYGMGINGTGAVSEENITKPCNIYAVTKAAQNMLGTVYANSYNLDIVMARSFNHIGPGQSEAFVISDFCRQVAEIEAKKRSNVINVGNLSAKRDFTDVRDIVKAYDLLMLNGAKGEIYNIGSGKALSIEEVLNIILSCSEAEIYINIDKSRFRPVEIPSICANTEKLYAVTGWEPEIPLKKTIEDTLNFWRIIINECY